MNYRLQRIVGYILGFVLFYAPCALFQRSLYYVFHGEWVEMSIHNVCFRIPLEHILDGKTFSYTLSYAMGTYLLLLSAFILGPLFCGKLCPAGALSELLSYILPDKWKIDWSKYVDIAPMRYGMLTGYIVLPFLGGIAACAFCNYYLFDLLINYVCLGYFVSLTSSMLLTGFLWLIVFGVFTKGGRGFCNFLCPVGAMLNLMHRVGSYFSFTLRMNIDDNKCIACGKCTALCPMCAIKINENKAKINIDNCNCCGVCEHNCPAKAIKYGRKRT